MYEIDDIAEEIELTEGSRGVFLVNDKKKVFKRVNGTKINKEYFTYKSKHFDWCIYDTASGLQLAVDIPTLAAAKDYVNNMSDELKERIKRIRTTAGYQEWCQKVKNANPEDYELEESYYFSVYDELDALSESKQSEAKLLK